MDWCAASGGISCISDHGWRFFTACELERNVHWWRYDFEALALPSLTALGANARRILVLGGVSGGGVISSFLQSSDVEEVLWVSEMRSVIKAAGRCVPSLSWLARPDPRLRVVHLDTQEFLRLAVDAGHFDIVFQDTLSLYRDEKRSPHWKSDVTKDYFAAWRLEVIQQLLSPRGLLVATAGYLTTPRSLRVAYDALAPYFKQRHTLQFSAPDTAHATGVTIAFIAGDESTMQMNQSWWRAQSIETCFYTEEMHAALLAPSKTLMKILGLGSAPPNVNDLPRRTCAYEEAWNLEKNLFAQRSKFQKLKVKKEKPSEDTTGCTSLFLDNELQETDVYGDFYHEAMVHVAMAQLGASRNGQRVLLLGGGDGGAASQVLKYPDVEVLQVEIDEMVIETSQRFFQSFASAFGHPRHKLIVADAVRWVEQNCRDLQQTFDLCIIDSTDEPLASAWSGKFYDHLKSMLKAHGAIVQNIGSQLDTLAQFRAWHLPLFQHRRLINCLTPDYESPYFLAFLADVEINPVNWTWWTNLNISTIYYHPGLHDALLAVPKETIESYVDGKEWVPHDAMYCKQHFRAAVKRSSGEL
eukprot:s27_g28.t1